MNKERLLELADVIEKGHHKFNGINAILDMRDWLSALFKHELNHLTNFRKDLKAPNVNECNTVACMAGWACLLFDYENASKSLDPKTPAYLNYDVQEVAAKLLELEPNQVISLFTSHAHDTVTGPQAAAVIRNFVKTGRVSWAKFKYLEASKTYHSFDNITDEDIGIF